MGLFDKFSISQFVSAFSECKPEKIARHVLGLCTIKVIEYRERIIFDIPPSIIRKAVLAEPVACFERSTDAEHDFSARYFWQHESAYFFYPNSFLPTWPSIRNPPWHTKRKRVRFPF